MLFSPQTSLSLNDPFPFLHHMFFRATVWVHTNPNSGGPSTSAALSDHHLWWSKVRNYLKKTKSFKPLVSKPLTSNPRSVSPKSNPKNLDLGPFYLTIKVKKGPFLAF